VRAKVVCDIRELLENRKPDDPQWKSQIAGIILGIAESALQCVLQNPRHASSIPDLMQETAMKVLKVVQGGTPIEPKRFTSYVRTAARTVAYDFLRRHRNDARRLGSLPEEIQDEPRFQSAVECQELAERIESTLTGIDLIIFIGMVKDWSDAEIAERAGVSESTVRHRRAALRKRLRRWLEGLLVLLC
jgi:RNA polymerase sigma factor (sigma-70 family)